jgi:hypothetical protein
MHLEEYAVLCLPCKPRSTAAWVVRGRRCTGWCVVVCGCWATVGCRHLPVVGHCGCVQRLLHTCSQHLLRTAASAPVSGYSVGSLLRVAAVPIVQAHIRLIDALYALGRYKDVAAALAAAEAKDASFRSLPEYKVRAGCACVPQALLCCWAKTWHIHACTRVTQYTSSYVYRPLSTVERDMHWCLSTAKCDTHWCSSCTIAGLWCNGCCYIVHQVCYFTR